VEGATVGPSDFTFRSNPDVIRGSDIPPGYAAVFSGHIHRHQVLTRDLSGTPLAAPVLYPGSVERTAFAEKDEAKGYIMLEARKVEGRAGGAIVDWRFEDLEARPMVLDELNGDGLGPLALRRLIQRAIERVPADSVLRLKIHGRVPAESRAEIAAARVRAMAPEEMNIEVVLAEEPRRARRTRGARSRERRSA
jgi:DNA repair exonuclease SbcCD nuclease subunit